MFKRIVVPVDFSAPSLRALDYAVEVGRPKKAEIILVHAVEPLYYAGPAGFYAPTYDAGMLLQQFRKAAREGLSQIARRLEKRHLHVHPVLGVGRSRRGHRRHGQEIEGRSDRHLHPWPNGVAARAAGQCRGEGRPPRGLSGIDGTRPRGASAFILQARPQGNASRLTGASSLAEVRDALRQRTRYRYVDFAAAAQPGFRNHIVTLEEVATLVDRYGATEWATRSSSTSPTRRCSTSESNG